MTLNDDATMLQYLDGPAASPPSADGAEVHVTAIGGDRVPLYEAGVAGTARVSTNGSITAHPCDGYASSGASCSAGFGFNRVPHWVSAYAATDKPAPKALELNWTAKGTVRLKFKQPIDLQASAAVDLRIALDPKSDPAAFEVRAIDANGGSATLGTRTVFPMPGRKRIGKVWARSLRAPLRDAVGFDRTQVVALQLVALRGTGHGFLLDAMGVGKHLLAMPARRPARADVATIEVPEGDTPGQHVQVPVTLDPAPPAGARVWVEVAGITATSGYMQTIAPGATSFDVTVTWDGDTVAFGDQFVGIAVFGLANITTRQYLGGVWIRDDD